MSTPDETELPAWPQRYDEKTRTAEEAVSAVQSGDHVFIGSGAAEPQRLVEALVARANSVFGTEIMHIMTLGIAPYTEPKWGDNFRHNAL
ncbi:MAG TPA: 4-hydroxybutyrate CoA-transferase, partial [Thermoplasmata archaeon]|nr:4-hydroxybutyrate CoA-transferase [Thermoplasmata archaeon]